jgi:hypothetical protein
MLTTFLYPVSRLRGGAELLILLYFFMAWTGTTLHFFYKKHLFRYVLFWTQAKNEYAAGLSSAAVFPVCFLSLLGRKAESRTVAYSVEVKLSLPTSWGHTVGIEVQLHSFLTSVLDGGEWSVSPPEKAALKALHSPLVRKCQKALKSLPGT